MKDRSGEEVRRYFGKALKICLHHEWTSFVMEMVSCVNNCPRLSLVNLITCLCWVTDQIIKKLGVSQSEIIFFEHQVAFLPGELLRRRVCPWHNIHAEVFEGSWVGFEVQHVY